MCSSLGPCVLGAYLELLTTLLAQQHSSQRSAADAIATVRPGGPRFDRGLSGTYAVSPQEGPIAPTLRQFQLYSYTEETYPFGSFPLPLCNCATPPSVVAVWDRDRLHFINSSANGWTVAFARLARHSTQ